MVSPEKRVKLQDSDDSISGYLHNVTAVKTSKNRIKYFNAVLQVSRKEYRHVVVFAADKRTSFHQAEKQKSPIKKRVRKYQFY